MGVPIRNTGKGSSSLTSKGGDGGGGGASVASWLSKAMSSVGMASGLMGGVQGPAVAFSAADEARALATVPADRCDRGLHLKAIHGNRSFFDLST